MPAWKLVITIVGVRSTRLFRVGVDVDCRHIAELEHRSFAGGLFDPEGIVRLAK